MRRNERDVRSLLLHCGYAHPHSMSRTLDDAMRGRSRHGWAWHRRAMPRRPFGRYDLISCYGRTFTCASDHDAAVPDPTPFHPCARGATRPLRGSDAGPVSEQMPVVSVPSSLQAYTTYSCPVSKK